MKKTKILFFVNVDWFFISHRLPIAIDAAAKGYEVHVATTVTNQAKQIIDHGFILHDINISRGKTNPFFVIKNLFDIIFLFKKIKPNIVHLVTIKPILLGGIAARLTNVQGVVAAISGLGYIFINQGFIASIRRFLIKLLYRLSLRHKNIMIICQNQNDLQEIKSLSKLTDSSFTIIEGSGVSLEKFKYFPDTSVIPNVMMASRLLIDKGVVEFYEAAAILKQIKLQANFVLVGETDPDNPASIPDDLIEKWKNENIVEFWGHRSDMQNHLPKASIVVLPSYREGFPKVLIEAAACGRPVITTDVPGCRDAIYNTKTGILVPPRNAKALADAIKKLILDNPTRQMMGTKARQMSEVRFDEKMVITKHLHIYKQLVENANKTKIDN
jgi:glycosyltransferase involved in cell wall biosynthesis